MTPSAEALRVRIGERIRQTMERRQMSFTELSQDSGVSRAHVYGIANGRTSATTDTLAKLADALQVDAVVFLRPIRKPPAE
ncbi:MAG: helix-turn-helix transcriptional regulator [Nannocystaceae bacterium]